MKISQLALGASATIFALALTGCSSESGSTAAPDADCKPVSEFTTASEGVIKAAGMNEMPGFLGISDQGPFEGFNATLFEQFAAENCLTVDWTPSTGAGATLALQEEKVDIFVGIVVKSEARGEIFNQPSSELFFEAAGILSEDGWSSVGDLQGKQVGAVTGSTYTTPLMEAIGEANLTQYQSSDAAYSDLKAGRIDAVVTPSVPQGWYVHENPDLGVVSEVIEADDNFALLTQQYEVNWPVVKGNDGLSDAISDFYDRIHEDGSLEKILGEYDITDPFYFNGR
ncbi:transporter substrate-binding domain-containing protein [Cryobacterium sp. PH29-G1]|uniref:substrate-binding periplasmic protein n=1 Tax=Cryobacterium sp. PH29-G1 TaxID=3046211 RepID=UPI0024B91339|nr:transporter substrate-binding domain-containing protein [Cryobacterium sp. PH29-G1]MDJ0349617.1 transporter substrate-binding domain-containing protein [Cryobacterium sp. PH29-G1]